MLTKTTPPYWDKAKIELAKRDEEMALLMNTYPNSILYSRGQPFETLIRSIIGQQISVKAADAIWSRMISLVNITPNELKSQSFQSLRNVGLSTRKVEYCYSVCDYFTTKEPTKSHYASLSDNEIIKELTEIRGIGRWTAEMFLIFTLARPNIFPTADIGLLKGLEKHYGERIPVDKLTPRIAHELFYDQFSPWATVATWYLWRSLDPVEVNY